MLKERGRAVQPTPRGSPSCAPLGATCQLPLYGAPGPVPPESSGQGSPKQSKQGKANQAKQSKQSNAKQRKAKQSTANRVVKESVFFFSILRPGNVDTRKNGKDIHSHTRSHTRSHLALLVRIGEHAPPRQNWRTCPILPPEQGLPPPSHDR